jgi:hypothetical protein
MRILKAYLMQNRKLNSAAQTFEFGSLNISCAAISAQRVSSLSIHVFGGELARKLWLISKSHAVDVGRTSLIIDVG